MRDKIFASLFIFLFIYLGQVFCASQTLPLYTCEFYGQEESTGSLPAGAAITAYDPQGSLIGRGAVAVAGRYGFLSTYADGSATVTFYINGVRQQRQGIFNFGRLVKLNLGAPALDGVYYNLHLLGMPGYASFNNDPKYSGAAVADMITDYLSPANTETQSQLMTAGDANKDGVLSASELANLLNPRIPNAYNFGTTTEVAMYAGWGIIGAFDPANQDDCIKQICHWMAYRVPGAIAGKENVPTAIATSSDPATTADSDLSHWMSVVGVKTNQDPFPELGSGASFSDEYHVPQTLQLAGIYLNDSTQNGLGFHTYIAADVFKNTYFRPMAVGLEDAGKYVAVMEPPDPKAAPVETVSPQPDDQLKITLGQAQGGVAIFIPGLVDNDTKNYLITIFNRLKDSPDFKTLLGDPYFGPAIKDAQVNRCFKVTANSLDYTIIPFDKTDKNGVLVTFAVMTVNNQTGQFQMAGADNKPKDMFKPLSLVNSYKTLRKNIGWQRGQFPIAFYLSSRQGSQLYPGWDNLVAQYKQQGSIASVTTACYSVTGQKQMLGQNTSAQVDAVSDQIIQTQDGQTMRLVLLNIKNPANYVTAVNKTPEGQEIYLSLKGNELAVVVKGQSLTGGSIKVSSQETGAGQLATYIYL